MEFLHPELENGVIITFSPAVKQMPVLLEVGFGLHIISVVARFTVHLYDKDQE